MNRRSFPGPDCRRPRSLPASRRWMQMCAGSSANSGKETQEKNLPASPGPASSLSRLSFLLLPLEGAQSPAVQLLPQVSAFWEPGAAQESVGKPATQVLSPTWGADMPQEAILGLPGGGGGESRASGSSSPATVAPERASCV